MGGTYDDREVRYFTAHVRQKPQNERQTAYHRALKLTGVRVHAGTFYENIPKRRPLEHPIPGLPKWVDILDREEKGSDVNLASHLLLDACHKRFDVALVVSNDSDQLTPIQIVRKEFEKKVIVANPSATEKFCLPGDERIRVRETNLRDCQFPEVVNISGKTVTKPDTW